MRERMSRAMRDLALARADRKSIARNEAEIFGRLLGENT